MTVMTFGATCSSATTQYVKNTNARKLQIQYPRVVEAIQHCHYVDDYIDSFDSPEGCAEVTHQATQIHKAAGFYLRNFVTYQYAVPN